MGQEFHVVRCFTCRSFQVQQVKKVNKWSCKLCGERQSLVKEFGRGSGAECRRHVQKLNAMRGALLEEQEHSALMMREEEEQRADRIQPQVSRWNKYLDMPASPKHEDIVLKDQQLHGNNIHDRKRKRSEDQADGLQEESLSPEQAKCLRPQRHSDSLEICSPPRVSCSALQGERPPVCGWIQSTNGVTAPSVPNIVSRSRPLLPVSSMFESGEGFNFDDGDFLTD